MSKERFNDLLLRSFGVAGIVTTAVLATHRSKYPTVLGLYSTRYALVLLGLLLVSAGLFWVSVPQWRARLWRRPERIVPPRQAWALLVAGWLALPAGFLLLRRWLPDNENRDLLVSIGLVFIAFAVGMLLWWRGFPQDSGIQPRWYWLIAVFFFQLIVVYLFIGRVPHIKLSTLVWSVGSGYKQYFDISRLILISPERNADTWANFSATLPILGAYQRLFGVGILQARFFYLLLGWLATPFLYLTVKRLYGPVAACLSALLGILIPIHFNWTFSHIWVATATAIALYYLFVFIHSADDCRRWLYLFLCGFFATSAIEGHAYGGAFAVMFLLVILWQQGIEHRKRQQIDLRAIAGILLGMGGFAVIYLLYHFYLPGVRVIDIPNIMQATLDAERAFGEARFGVGITYSNIWKMAQYYVFTNVFEVILLILAFCYMCLNRKKEEKILLSVYLGAYFMIFSQLAHVNEFYWVFAMPFVAIGFGAFASVLPISIANGKRGVERVTFGGVYLVLVVLTLYSIQVYLSAEDERSQQAWFDAQNLAAIGRDIGEFLPEEEIVIAGNSGYYLGMGERLNYWISFSFTWEDSKYWPLEFPQAIIVTLGVDEGYSGLAEWLVEYDFQAIECFPFISAKKDARAAILYASPELNLPESRQNCTPELLAWLSS